MKGKVQMVDNKFLILQIFLPAAKVSFEFSSARLLAFAASLDSTVGAKATLS